MTEDETGASFSYRKGSQIFTTPWRQPTLENFYRWWDLFLPHLLKTSFFAWLVGGFNEKRDTWDLDVILTQRGPLRDDQLELLCDLLLFGTKVALDQCETNVDLQFYENLPGRDFLTHGIHSFWYSPDEYLKNGPIWSRKWVAFDVVYQNGTKLLDLNETPDLAIKKRPDLWQVKYLVPTPKYERRIREDGYRESEPQLLFAPGEIAFYRGGADPRGIR